MNENEVNLKETIVKNLEQNGFPEKSVTLPLEKLYEVADNKEANLNKILDSLREEGLSIDLQTANDRILFSKKTVTENPFAGLDPNDFDLNNIDMSDKEGLKNKAQEFMKNMTPEQMSSIKQMFDNMTPEQREEILKKGRELGIG